MLLRLATRRLIVLFDYVASADRTAVPESIE